MCLTLRKQYFEKIFRLVVPFAIGWAICDWQIGQPICKLARLADWTEHIHLFHAHPFTLQEGRFPPNKLFDNLDIVFAGTGPPNKVYFSLVAHLHVAFHSVVYIKLRQSLDRIQREYFEHIS